jgi:uncharacterized protein (TIGR03032 family)
MDTSQEQATGRAEAATAAQQLQITASEGLKPFLLANNVSLVLTTYQSGRVLVVSGNPSGPRLAFVELKLKRPMGIAVQGRRLAIGLHREIMTFTDILPPGERNRAREDAIYLAQAASYTTDVDIHDVAFGDDRRVYFANTSYSCICTTSEDYSFRPVWKPPFITALLPEDRCHLNGIAVKDGALAYASLCARADERTAWKQGRDGAGCIYDVSTSEIVCDQLTMPHSPRWHDGALWVLNSGQGEIGIVDLERRRFEPLAFLPGYLRGLSFFGKYAVVGLSRPRENSVFAGLPLQAGLDRRGLAPMCGIVILDRETGAVIHSLVLEGAVTELYDTGVLSGINLPAIFLPDSEDPRRFAAIEPGLTASR